MIKYKFLRRISCYLGKKIYLCSEIGVVSDLTAPHHHDNSL